MNAPRSPALRAKILVAEDEEDVRYLLVRSLSALGDVTAAADGLEAYEHMAAGLAPDVIVTDLMMPRMDGLTLVKRLKEEGLLRKTPVIILTARTRAMEVIEGIQAGARHYITKPFQTQDLVDKVHKALGAKAP